MRLNAPFQGTPGADTASYRRVTTLRGTESGRGFREAERYDCAL